MGGISNADQVTLTREEVDLVQAIRRAIGNDLSTPVSVRFTVFDIFDFAAKLRAEGVTIREEKVA